MNFNCLAQNHLLIASMQFATVDITSDCLPLWGEGMYRVASHQYICNTELDADSWLQPLLWYIYSTKLVPSLTLVAHCILSQYRYITTYIVRQYIIVVITSVLHGGYVIIGVCPSVCLFVNSVTQKLICGFFSNFHTLSTYT